MKVTVHDHVIVGASGRTSMRAMGLINVRFRPIAVIGREPKAYGTEIPLRVVRERSLSGC